MDCPLRTTTGTLQTCKHQKWTFGEKHRFHRIIIKVYYTTNDKRCDDTQCV